MRCFIIIIALLACTTNAVEGDKTIYYCSDEAATGLFDGSSGWQSSPVKKGRFKMAMTGIGDDAELKIDDTSFTCKKPIISVLGSKEIEHTLACYDLFSGDSILFDVSNKRYVRMTANPYTYINGDDSPGIAAGKCEDF